MAGGGSRNEASSSRGRGRSGGGAGDRGESVVTDCGRRRLSCGYCKSKSITSIAHGLWAYSLTVDDYQDLLDRGWRRSGCFLYKPEMERTCCPSYTIRLKAADFVPSKEQNRVYRRFERFLDGNLEVKKQEELPSAPSTSKELSNSSAHEVSNFPGQKPATNNKDESAGIEDLVGYLVNEIENVINRWRENRKLPSNVEFPKPSVREVSQAKKKKVVKGSEDLLYTCNIAFRIAAAVSRMQSNKMDVQEDIGKTRDSEEDKGRSFKLLPGAVAEELVLSFLQKTADMSIRACNGHINFYSSGRKDSAAVITKSVACSKDSQTMNGCIKTVMKCSQSTPGKKQNLEIQLKRSNFDPEANLEFSE